MENTVTLYTDDKKYSMTVDKIVMDKLEQNRSIRVGDEVLLTLSKRWCEVIRIEPCFIVTHSGRFIIGDEFIEVRRRS